MCAGTVVEPLGPTSAEIDSVTSTSRSVALKVSFDFSALINTLARIGMVLRRSTTRWTWPSDFNSAARSTVTFIFQSARSRGKVQKGVRKVARARVFRKGDGTGRRQLPNGFGRDPGLPLPLGTREKARRQGNSSRGEPAHPFHLGRFNAASCRDACAPPHSLTPAIAVSAVRSLRPGR